MVKVVVKSTRLLTKLGLNPGSATHQLSSCKFFTVFMATASEDRIYFMELLVLNDITDIKLLAQCLAHSMCSINICCYYSPLLGT